MLASPACALWVGLFTVPAMVGGPSLTHSALSMYEGVPTPQSGTSLLGSVRMLLLSRRGAGAAVFIMGADERMWQVIFGALRPLEAANETDGSSNCDTEKIRNQRIYSSSSDLENT